MLRLLVSWPAACFLPGRTFWSCFLKVWLHICFNYEIRTWQCNSNKKPKSTAELERNFAFGSSDLSWHYIIRRKRRRERDGKRERNGQDALHCCNWVLLQAFERAEGRRRLWRFTSFALEPLSFLWWRKAKGLFWNVWFKPSSSCRFSLKHISVLLR